MESREDLPLNTRPSKNKIKVFPSLTYSSAKDRKVLQVGDEVVIKSGRIQPHEALTLAFIAANTTIPVPRVREIQYEENHVSAIVMDYMASDSMKPGSI